MGLTFEREELLARVDALSREVIMLREKMVSAIYVYFSICSRVLQCSVSSTVPR